LHSDAQIIASGGLRSGLDVARAIRLGAHIGSAASPFLKAAQVGQQALSDLIEQWHEQLRITCFITASANLAALRQAPLIESP
jgi:isopentenyl-diphosphate delta-isomerase